jgi:glycine/D-amino acid oxidase-like deaminating enzyme
VLNAVNGGVSFWNAQLGEPMRRAPLQSSTSVDVCIVGAGLTGLWTAYYLKRAAPELSVVVVEREFAGFGASGRNGGWLSALVAGSLDRYAKRCGVDAAQNLQRTMIDTVDEVIRVAHDEGIHADIVKGGVLRIARSAPQLQRLRDAVIESAHWHNPYEVLSGDEARVRVDIAGTVGASYSVNGARLHPAKLVRGLAEVVEASGVTIHESTPVSSIRPHEVTTPCGVVSAEYVVRATEGFTSALPGLHRRWLPMNSSMIVTAPIPDATWDQIGWGGCETLGDSAHTFMYAQRTADNRIAIGGRGVPYRYGSRTDRNGETAPVTVRELREIVTDFFPMLRDIGIDHAWSGVLGVPRDWCASVSLDPATGLCEAGGYVGHGVTATNLAGRTLRDLVLGRETDLTHLPWVDWTCRRWEPEPLRWLGVRSMYLAYRAADRAEARGGSSTSRIARLADKISGQ